MTARIQQDEVDRMRRGLAHLPPSRTDNPILRDFRLLIDQFTVDTGRIADLEREVAALKDENLRLSRGGGGRG